MMFDCVLLMKAKLYLFQAASDKHNLLSAGSLPPDHIVWTSLLKYWIKLYEYDCVSYSWWRHKLYPSRPARTALDLSSSSLYVLHQAAWPVDKISSSREFKFWNPVGTFWFLRHAFHSSGIAFSNHVFTVTDPDLKLLLLTHEWSAKTITNTVNRDKKRPRNPISPFNQ